MAFFFPNIGTNLNIIGLVNVDFSQVNSMKEWQHIRTKLMTFFVLNSIASFRVTKPTSDQ